MRHVTAQLSESPVGSGTRCFLILEERGRRVRLLYVPFLRAFWAEARNLVISKDLGTRGLASRIRANRRERNLLNLSYSGPAVRYALEQLRGAAKPAPEEVEDDALWGAREVDDELNPNEGDASMDTNTPATGTAATATPAAATTPVQTNATPEPKKKAKPAKAAAAPKGKAPAAKPTSAAATADVSITGKPNPATNGAAAAGDGKKAAGKKAAKPAAAKKPSAGSSKWTGTETIVTKSKENPSRPGSRLHKLYSELQDGMTVTKVQEVMRRKHSVEESVTSAMLRHMVGWGKVEVRAAK